MMPEQERGDSYNSVLSPDVDQDVLEHDKNVLKRKGQEHQLYLQAKKVVFGVALIVSIVFLGNALCLVNKVVNAEVNALEAIEKNKPNIQLTTVVSDSNKSAKVLQSPSKKALPSTKPEKDIEHGDDKSKLLTSFSGYITILIVSTLAVGLTIFIALLKTSFGFHVNEKKEKDIDVKALTSPIIEFIRECGKAFRGGS